MANVYSIVGYFKRSDSSFKLRRDEHILFYSTVLIL